MLYIVQRSLTNKKVFAMENKMRLKEVMIFYCIISLFGLFLGYIIYDLGRQFNIIEVNQLFDSSILKETAGSSLIFKNNLLFFSVICIMPIVNIMIVIVQFFNLGSFIYICKGLSIELQFILLYRHTFFEIIAVFISVYISYLILLNGREYIEALNMVKGYYFKKVKYIGLLYLLVVILTCIGAVLEGNVIVPV